MRGVLNRDVPTNTVTVTVPVLGARWDYCPVCQISCSHATLGDLTSPYAGQTAGPTTMCMVCFEIFNRGY